MDACDLTEIPDVRQTGRTLHSLKLPFNRIADLSYDILTQVTSSVYIIDECLTDDH